jgi:dephospho-CoA kinase
MGQTGHRPLINNSIRHGAVKSPGFPASERMMRNKMRVGLTGGFAAGKSVVSRFLHEHYGVAIVDVDAAGRSAVNDHPKVLNALRVAFGDEFFFADGSLNRKKLGLVVFGDVQARRTLDQIVHPVMLEIVKQDMQREMAQNGGTPYFVVDGALLYELELHAMMDLVVLVHAPLAACIERARLRDGISAEDVQRRYQAQMPVSEKMQRADYVIENDGDLNQVKNKVNALHAILLERAKCKDNG